MTSPVRLLVVALAAAALGPPARAEDKPPAKPDDARRAALVKAGYTAVPLVQHTFGPGGGATLFAVECNVGTEKTKFVINTEPGNSSIDAKLARKLKLELVEAKRADGEVGRAADLGGLVLGGYDTRKDSNRLVVVVEDQSALGGIGGYVGRDILDFYAAVIDSPARVLYLRSPLTTAWPKLVGKWAASSVQMDGAAQKIDPKDAPTLEFVNRRLKFADGGEVHEFAVHLVPRDDGTYVLALFDPKDEGKANPDYQTGGLIRVKDGTMTACLALGEEAKDVPTEFTTPKGSGHVLFELKHTAPDSLKPPADPLRDLLTKDGFAAVKLDRGPTGERTVAAKVGTHDARFVLHTGSSHLQADQAVLKRWGAAPVGDKAFVENTLGSKDDVAYFRGLKFGGYDTRSSMSVVIAVGEDLAEANKDRKHAGWPAVDGYLGLAELRNGAAVIDLHHDTLYLRPVLAELWPRLEGKWVGVSLEEDGRKGRQRDAARTTLEFQDGRVRFRAPGARAEWAAHVQDEGRLHRFAFFDPKLKETDPDFGYNGGGIFKLTDDGRLTFVLFTDLTTKNDPIYTFDAPKGSGRVLFEFVRAK